MPAFDPLNERETTEEWLAWYALTPAQRFRESEKLWATFRALGGSLEPEPDWQSPVYFPDPPDPRAAHGWAQDS